MSQKVYENKSKKWKHEKASMTNDEYKFNKCDKTNVALFIEWKGLDMQCYLLN